ncbi:ethanolamine utilization protein EutN [Bacillus sp. FJAT-27231]|uniref:EutN/CcmL family microcompartment protein n=1 Tax=Bacillus sp. FJAT-27231 TaxID=1679168 RepID=UPI000671482C|nr:EutN/CcmL family microcompartment protein [Bacillus sp. FJAT-27231]KMY53784.1 ethanolamine utilization protein EutN [Bacillus sp. FJAT-27231]
MIIGKVVGNIWATRKEEGLTGFKLLTVQPLDVEGNTINVNTIVAVDRIGAGIGDKVLVTTGAPASFIDQKRLPVDALIVGIIDQN